MTQDRARILVVDDEENIRFLVESAMQLEGFDTTSAETGREAIRLAESYRPHVIVLDVMLPDIDGFAVLKRLRDAGSKVSVIFLTARDSTEDRVQGLTDGGDDYVVKPFAVAELVARVHLRLRESEAASAHSKLQCADLELDDDAHRVTRSGELVNLSPTEYRLLHYLLLNSGRVMSRSQILDQVWAYDWGTDTSVVDTYISYLRRKVDNVEPKLIHTVRGVGFCLRVES